MRVNINIIPDEQKRERETERKVGAIARFGFSLTLALLVLSAALTVAQLVLDADYQSAKAGSPSPSGGSAGESDQAESFLKKVNSLAKKINVTSAETPRWSKIFLEISDEAPEDIKLTAIHIEKEHLKIDGFSKTREAFLAFQDKLRAAGFKNLVSPVSNVVSPKDFNFEMEADLDKNYLDQP